MTAYEMRISGWSSDVCSSDLSDDDERCTDRIGERHGWCRDQRRPDQAATANAEKAGGESNTQPHRHQPGEQHRSCRARQPDIRIILTPALRSEEHTSELQSLMRISYPGLCLKKKKHERKID